MLRRFTNSVLLSILVVASIFSGPPPSIAAPSPASRLSSLLFEVPDPQGAVQRNIRYPEQFTWPNEDDSLSMSLVDRTLFASSYCSFPYGDRLYVGAGSAILIFDITNPMSPSLLGHVYTASIVWNIFVEGDTAYVANAYGGLSIYDCDVPAQCREIGDLDNVAGGHAYGVCANEGYAFIADGGAGLLIVDVSNESGPELAAHYDPFPGSMVATDVKVLGDLVFVCMAEWYAGNGMLAVIDASIPSAPDTISMVYTGGPARALHVEPDTTLYIANGMMYAGGISNLLVLDCSDPEDPRELGYYGEWTDYGLDVFVEGDRIYLANGYMGGETPNVLVFDVADVGPEMVPVGGYLTQNLAWGISTRDGIAYVSDEWGGLDVVDCREEGNIYSLEIFDIGGYPQDVAVWGETVYVAAKGGNIRVVDASDPENLEEVAIIDTRSWASAVAVRGDTLFVVEGWDLPAQGPSGLEVILATDPTNPIVLDDLDYDQTAHCYDLFLDGNLIYIAKGIDGLLIVDAGDKANLVELTIYDTPKAAYDVFIEDSVAYVADGQGGLLLLDVSDPMNPSPMGSYDPWLGTSNGVWVSDSLAYIADGSMGFRIFNCADPWNPEQIGYLDTGGDALKVVVKDDRAYLTDGIAGLRVINVEDPTNPVEEAYYNTNGKAYGVCVQGDDIWVADHYAGLLLLQMEAALTVGGGGEDLPRMRGDYLAQNKPNPFNPSTVIEYEVGGKGRIELDIFSSRGRKVRTLKKGDVEEGTYQVIWDGKDDLGRNLSSGIYIYRLKFDSDENAFSSIRKMVMTR